MMSRWAAGSRAEGLFLARRDKARNRYHSTAGLLNDLVDRRAMFFNGLFERQSDVKEKRRAQDRQVADRVEDWRQALGVGNELLAGYRAADETVGVLGLPKRPSRVEPNVAPNRLELGGAHWQVKPKAFFPSELRGSYPRVLR